jgi:preprotein translocase subunit SecA
MSKTLGCNLSVDQIGKMDRDELMRSLCNAVEDRFHPEIRRMERQLLLEIVDSAWKDHLLAMDHLRSSIGLVGYAQLDAKVEYKREGMKLFTNMWTAIGERTTDLIFRMEQLNEDFVSSTWVETAATHETAKSTSEIVAQQQQAINASQGEVRLDPIRNRGHRVGRNDPCPCNSGKKYKNCCMRKEAI